MNADRLLTIYDRIAEAPDAIARLRRFVLDLAVRGKLVEQDPEDEPASELLKRDCGREGAVGEGEGDQETASLSPCKGTALSDSTELAMDTNTRNHQRSWTDGT